MNHYKLSAIILGLVFLCSGLSVEAQSWSRINFRTDFDFHIAGEKFKSGEYMIEKAGAVSDIYRICHRDGKPLALFTMRSANRWAESGRSDFVLSFNNYGNDYFLNTIFNKSLGFRAELWRSNKEVEFAREFKRTKKEVAVNTPSGK